MKVIVAGSRSIVSVHIIGNAMARCGFDITEVVSGGADGVDKIGEGMASAWGIPVKIFPVTRDDWKKCGKSAGPRRNQMMVDYADALVAIWDGESRGTSDVIGKAKKAGLKVFIYKKVGDGWQGEARTRTK